MKGSQVKPGERVKDVRFTEDTLSVDLIDGRTITVPLAWYPRLLDATAEQRRNWKIAGAGYGIHWPDVHEDLSTEGLLRGAPAAPEPARTQVQLTRPTLADAKVRTRDPAKRAPLLGFLEPKARGARLQVDWSGQADG